MSRPPYGQEIQENEGLLYRQIHPNFLDGGQPSSQAFCPTEKDEGLLSAAASSLTTPEDSFAFYTQTLGLASAGVYAVSAAECRENCLPPHYDPLTVANDGVDYPEHACADFRAHLPTRQKKLAKRLKKDALARGLQYAPVLTHRPSPDAAQGAEARP